jgi:uncharacterized protein YutE (UPF0331/DUF86 family)
LRFLEEFKDKSKEELEKSFRDLQAIKYSLLEITEACIDIANHIIAAKGLERAEEYSKMFLILAENKIIPEELGEKLAKMAKFRNLLIHRYGIVKIENLIEIINHHLVDVVDFMKQIKKLI